MKTIYDTDTGIVRLTGTFDEESLALNLEDGESVYDGYVDGSVHKVVDDEPVRLTKTVDISAWIRAQRAGLLEESDWTQVTDSPLTGDQRTEWQTHRQELRDLPSKYAASTSRFEVVFPDKPNT